MTTDALKNLLADREKDSLISFATKLHTFINNSQDPIELTFGKHTFAFTSEPDTVVYTVIKDNKLITTQRICLNESQMTLAVKLSDDTVIEVPPNDDNVYATRANVFNIDRALGDLLAYPPDYKSDPKYLTLITNLQKSDEPFYVTRGDVETTLKYTNMLLMVSTRIPNKFNRTAWFGRGSTLPLICEAIQDQYAEIETAALLPNSQAIYDSINKLCEA